MYGKILTTILRREKVGVTRNSKAIFEIGSGPRFPPKKEKLPSPTVERAHFSESINRETAGSGRCSHYRIAESPFSTSYLPSVKNLPRQKAWGRNLSLKS